MNRAGQMPRTLMIAMAITLLAMHTGCSAVMMAMYVVKGHNVNADYKGLRDQRVAVVCRPTASLEYSNVGVDKQVSRAIAKLLKDNVRKIRIVDPAEVEAWTDENTWDEYTEVGQALGADMVVAVDLERFSLYEGQTVMQGKANATVTVYDMKADGDVAYEKTLPETVFPPLNGIPASEQPEIEFRNTFIHHLAEEISRHFYMHDPSLDVARNGRSL